MRDNLVYGIHAVQAVLEKAPHTIKQLWVQQGRLDKKLTYLLNLGRKEQLSIQMVSSKTLNNIIDAKHQGIVIALITSKTNFSEQDLFPLLEKSHKPLFLILDGIEDPHNLGACLRSADAAGVTAVIVPKDKAVGLTPVVRKVACGAAQTVPFIQVTNLVRTLQQLQAAGVWLFGAAGEAKQSLYDCDFNGAIAIVMGHEGKGLRRLTRETCDYLMRIPMLGSVESLNVSVATGICLFEVCRQRRLSD